MDGWQIILADITDRLSNGRPPNDGPGEDQYYDRYEVSEISGYPVDPGGAVFTIFDTGETGNTALVRITGLPGGTWKD